MECIVMRLCVARMADPGELGERIWRMYWLRHLPVLRFMSRFVDGRRRLAPDYSGVSSNIVISSADGRGLRLLPFDYCRRPFKVSSYHQPKPETRSFFRDWQGQSLH